MKDRTRGKPSKEKTIVKQCKINDFNAMIEEALEAMERVLLQRELDLKTWGEKEQTEFYTIFGSRGERLIDVDMPLRGISSVQKMTARELMLDCIRRLHWIKNQLTLDSFVNMIHGPANPQGVNGKPDTVKIFTAYVNSDRQDDFKIFIGINFTGRVNSKNVKTCMSTTGADSRVSTLCHEMSHFVKHYSNPYLGGMGTLDYESDGSKPKGNKDSSSAKGHLEGANILVKRQGVNVFNNAYNIEKYFEIEV